MPRLPRERIFADPERSSPRVSPDGRRLAFLAPDEGILNLHLADGLDPEAACALDLEGARPLTRDRSRNIRAWFWAGDSKSLLYLQDRGGDEDWHLFQADAATGAVRDLTPHAGVQAQPIATEPSRPSELLLALNLRDKRLHDVYRVDLSTGECRLDVENPGDAVGWLADHDLQVRAYKAATPEGGGALKVRSSASEPWTTLLSWGPDEVCGARGFTPDGKGLYVESSLGFDTARLMELDLASGAACSLASHSEADLGPLLCHPTRHRVQAAGFETDRLRWTVLDEHVREDFAVLSDLAKDGSDFLVTSRDDADRVWTVSLSCDRRPLRYYLYDREERQARLLFSSHPSLEGLELACTRPVTVPARDGLKVPAYLTLPAGPEQDLPLVLLVHGGPWSRDRWGFSPEAQWLAGLGCAVLQVNYRGSAGFGKKFLRAGFREWGAKMQDDLTDAALWAVEKGIADRSRLAVFGWSYGGYAALAGAAFTPDLFACAVDAVGPSNLLTMSRSIPPYWEPLRRMFCVRVGDFDNEPEFLKSRSPLFSADRIRIPLLVAQGANDPRVKRAESEMIVEALRGRGRPVEYLLFDDEGHGLAQPLNRLRFYEAAERFLERYLLKKTV
ncbi:MAG TPA: S9 family peptidase [Elusimicrobia bacterium]|nr:S9 family peptidase [Elusimicrobiota bacterium]